MKCVILAGGLGTRITEESHLKPKPMIEIGDQPILWHIMKIYASHGINDFIICLGYKGYVIKEYFANYFLHASDVTFDLANNRMDVHHQHAEPWRVTLVNTGEHSMTGGRLKRVAKYITEDTFCFTYGDGVANINIRALIDFHHQQQRAATVTVVQPPGRFGALDITNQQATAFVEKPHGDGYWINGGFFVLNKSTLDLIDNDSTAWEAKPMQTLAASGQLSAFHHNDFWQPMDTMRDRNQLETLWNSGKAPWKTW